MVPFLRKARLFAGGGGAKKVGPFWLLRFLIQKALYSVSRRQEPRIGHLVLS